MNRRLQSLDWESIFAADPALGVALISAPGEILFVSEGLYNLFGIDRQSRCDGCVLADIFHVEFARERMRWIRRALSDQTRLRAEHIYQGRRIVSTLIPLASPPDGPCVLIISRPYATAIDQHVDNIPRVESELIDLGPLAELTSRELEVLVLLGHGKSVPETAKLLHRSPRTIEQHKRSIGDKLGVSTLARIAGVVHEAGLTINDLALKRYHALRAEYSQ